MAIRGTSLFLFLQILSDKDNNGNIFISKELNWREREALQSVRSLLKRGFEISSTFQSLNGNLESVRGSFKRVYDKMTTLENWIKTLLFVCVLALAIDPLFFFIPVIDSQRFCFTLDKKLGVAVCVLRTFIDTFYVIHIIFHSCSSLSNIFTMRDCRAF